MTHPSDKHGDKPRKIHLPAELLGVKVKVPFDAPPPQKEPETWKDVFKDINTSLKSVVSGVFGLPADAIRMLRGICQGVDQGVRRRLGSGKPPKQVKAKVEKARQLADKAESLRQQEHQSKAIVPATKAHEIDQSQTKKAKDALTQLFEKWKERGAIGMVIMRGKPPPVLIIGMPENIAVAVDAMLSRDGHAAVDFETWLSQAVGEGFAMPEVRVIPPSQPQRQT